MKKIQFFAMALAALAIVSCSKEKMGGDNNELGAIGEPTYATFSFKTAKAAIANEDDKGEGTDADIAAEKVIKTARLLIFSTGTTGALETNKLVTLTANGTKFSEVVKAGSKKMFVIANETGTMTAALSGLLVGTAKLSDFLNLKYDAGTTNGDDFTLAPLYTRTTGMGFPMSSPDDKTYTFLANVTKEQTEAANGPNAFELSLDYMLSKVAVVATDNVLDNSILKVTNMKFSIRNIAKETYLTQQFADADAKIVKSAYYDELPTDPNASASWRPFYHQTPEPSIPVAAAATKFIYTAENTKSTASLLAGGSTYAALSCIVTPKSSYDGADMQWNVSGANLSLGTAKPIADPTNGVGVDFVVTQRAIGNIKVGTVFTTVEILNKALAILEYKTAYIAQDPTTAAVVDVDYKIYKGGVAWYRINISKTVATAGVDQKQIYGVERGLQYTATITSITGFGLVGDDLSPETPLDQQTYISATINARGWRAAGSSTDL